MNSSSVWLSAHRLVRGNGLQFRLAHGGGLRPLHIHLYNGGKSLIAIRSYALEGLGQDIGSVKLSLLGRLLLVAGE
jgi:hypothetical protein